MTMLELTLLKHQKHQKNKISGAEFLIPRVLEFLLPIYPDQVRVREEAIQVQKTKTKIDMEPKLREITKHGELWDHVKKGPLATAEGALEKQTTYIFMQGPRMSQKVGS